MGTTAILQLSGGVTLLCLIGIAIRAYTAFRADQERSREDRDRGRSGLRARLVLASQSRPIQNPTPESAWVGWRKFEVSGIVEECDDVRSIYLTPHDGMPLTTFLPGQFLTIRVGMSEMVQPLVRCYSLSDYAPGEDYYRVSIKRIRESESTPPGRMSTYLHERVRVGNVLDVRAPGGHFFLNLAESAPVVLIAGGVGVTPILSMLQAVVKSAPQRRVTVLLTFQSPQQHPFIEETLRVLEGHDVHVDVITFYSRAREREGDQRLKIRYQRLSLQGIQEFSDRNLDMFYLCGPSAMMKDLGGGLKDWGVSAERLHMEAFGPASLPGSAPSTPDVPLTGFDVKFKRSGKTARFDSRFETLLDLAESEGLSIPSGCRAGNCGTCAVDLLEGQVTHKGSPAASLEPDSCLACVAVPTSRIVIDV